MCVLGDRAAARARRAWGFRSTETSCATIFAPDSLQMRGDVPTCGSRTTTRHSSRSCEGRSRPESDSGGRAPSLQPPFGRDGTGSCETTGRVPHVREYVSRQALMLASVPRRRGVPSRMIRMTARSEAPSQASSSRAGCLGSPMRALAPPRADHHAHSLIHIETSARVSD